MNPNKDITFYTDYHLFLRDHFQACKKSMPRFSYRVIAERAGLASPSFLRMVIQGTKNLTPESAAKVAGALRLNAKATEYFVNLVKFAQTSSLDEKDRLLKKVDRYGKKNSPELLLPKEYDYLKNWLHAVVRETVEMESFVEDAKTLAARFTVPVTAAEIEQSIKFLVENGFLGRDANGKLYKKDKTISTVEIPHNERLILIAKKYHLSIMDLAGHALREQPRKVRSITSTTLSLSQSSYELAQRRVENLRFELLELAAADKEKSDRVYELAINLFPVVINSHE